MFAKLLVFVYAFQFLPAVFTISERYSFNRPTTVHSLYKTLLEEVQSRNILLSEPILLQESLKQSQCLDSTQKSDIHLKDKSSCLWGYRTIHNPNIYPEKRIEAICRCQKCQMYNVNATCQPLFVETLILNRTISDEGGIEMFHPEIIHVKSGCACVPENVNFLKPS
nr:interleukin 17-19 [Sepiella japonica]